MMPGVERRGISYIQRATARSPTLQRGRVDEAKLDAIVLPKESRAGGLWRRRGLDPTSNGERSAVVQQAVVDADVPTYPLVPLNVGALLSGSKPFNCGGRGPAVPAVAALYVPFKPAPDPELAAVVPLASLKRQ